MSTVGRAALGQVDNLILRVLREHREQMTTSRLVSIVLEHTGKFSDVDIKRAVWRMIAARQVELSSDQFLREVRSSNHR
jgi:RNA:NAD 2'-phosphotransferase (TPT1/KptA family)